MAPPPMHTALLPSHSASPPSPHNSVKQTAPPLRSPHAEHTQGFTSHTTTPHSLSPTSPAQVTPLQCHTRAHTDTSAGFLSKGEAAAPVGNTGPNPARRFSPPLQRVSPTLPNGTLAPTLTPNTSRTAINGALPPLPPMAYNSGSPAFGPSVYHQPNGPPDAWSQVQRKYSLSSSNLPAQANGSGLVSPATSPVHALRLMHPSTNGSPLLHFQPRPTSPNSLNLSTLSSPTLKPLIGSLPNGMVCTCVNSPINPQPCSCSVVGAGSLTPIGPSSRLLPQSLSMDFMRQSSHGGSTAGMSQSPPPPSTLPLPQFVSPSSHHAGPPHRRKGSLAPSSNSMVSTGSSSLSSLNSMSIGSGSGPASSSPSLSSSGQSASSLLAAQGMAPASGVPTAAHGNVSINMYSGQPQLSVTVPTRGHSGALTSPAEPHVLRHSIFSPSAPPDVLALMQRQASVSPTAYASSPTAGLAPTTPTLRPNTNRTTIRISPPVTPTPAAGVVRSPTTEESSERGRGWLSTVAQAVRLMLRGGASDATTAAESIAATAAISPGKGVSLLSPASSACPHVPHVSHQAGSPHCSSPHAACADCMVRMRGSQQQVWTLPSSSPRASSAASTAVAGGAVVAASSPLPPSSSGCTCLTRPLLCVCGHNLHRCETAPNFVLGNPHMITGYRGVLTPKQCIASLGQLHNESCNVYSHLAGAAWMASLWSRTRGTPALQLQVLGGTTLFSCSALAHLFAPVSTRCNTALFRVDRCAIAMTEMMIGVATALIYFDRPGEGTQQKFATIGANVALGLAAMRMLWKEDDPLVTSPSTPPPSPRRRLLKVGVLALQIVVFALPVLREFMRTRDHTLRGILRRYSLLAAGAAVLGAGFYASYMPERMVYAREVEENARRHAAGAAAAAAAASSSLSVLSPSTTSTATPSPLSAGSIGAARERGVSVSSPSTPPSAAAPAVSVPSPSSTSKRVPPLPVHLQSSRRWRLLHWLTNHFMHSHHLMHISVVLATHWVFVLCDKWHQRKIEMADLAAAANAVAQQLPVRIHA